jgi:hypothetical protein
MPRPRGIVLFFGQRNLTETRIKLMPDTDATRSEYDKGVMIWRRGHAVPH